LEVLKDAVVAPPVQL
jgi:hypothetical protein